MKSFINKRNGILHYAYNLKGWHTDRKIVVIESDDWGSIRMPSKGIYNKCIKAGYRVDLNPYERYDSLLSSLDLDLLFDLLFSFKDSNGRHPIITANCVVANPDFVKIKGANYENYYFELITDTFKRYPAHKDNFVKWQYAHKEQIFFPQYHAREHLNVSLFMEALRSGNRDAHFGFNNGMPGSISLDSENYGNRFVEALSFVSNQDKFEKLNIYLDGLDIFNNIFGFSSSTITPPNYYWYPDFDIHVYEKGVEYFQGIRIIREPINNKKYKTKKLYLGKRNKIGQLYLVRNSVFEPALFTLKIKNPVDRCLSDINFAFKCRKPAIISSHRINYVGYIEENNRDKSLKYLNELIKSMLKNWPDIEFMSSLDLGKVISENTESSKSSI